MTGTFLSYPPFVRIRTIGRIREGIFREGNQGFLWGLEGPRRREVWQGGKPCLTGKGGMEGEGY